MNVLNRFPALEFALVLTCVIIARLPYLLSDHVFFDGDEALLGIMARDLWHLDAFPVYFYGQRYGLAIFEVVATTLFIPFFGSSVLTLKLGGMLLMAVGFWRLIALVRLHTDSIWIYGLSLIVLVCIPPWTVQDRYMSAFLFSILVFESHFTKAVWCLKDWIKVMVYLVIVLLAQPLFLLALLPIMASRLFNKGQFKLAINASIPGAIFLGLMRIPALWNKDHWKPVKMGEIDLANFKHYFIDGFWSHVSGYFSYSDVYAVPFQVRMGIAGFLLLTTLMLVYSAIKGSRDYRLSMLVLLLCAISAVIALPFFGVAGARYVLGFHLILLFVVVTMVIEVYRINKWMLAIVLPFCIMFLATAQTGYGKYVSFWFAPELNDMQMLNELHETLEARNVNHVFVSEWNLLWQLNYLGEGRIAARMADGNERIDRFTDRVDGCYLDPNCPYALVGSHWPLLDMNLVNGWYDRTERLNERYYIMMDPEDAFLLKGQFELPEKLP
ncbi:MAG: hypothetical protein ACI97X_000379 [Oceanospirillaceae bacterium]|jgi:hypothetical protein